MNALVARLAAGLAILLAVAGCKKDTKVYVECTGVGTGFNCTVEHREGNDKVNVCWDVNVVCKNGTRARASACQIVSPSAKATAFIPASDVKNNDKCDVATSTSVDNLQATAAL